MNYFEIIGTYDNLIEKIEITKNNLYIHLMTRNILAREFISISNTLSTNGYEISDITTNDEYNILLVFAYVRD